MPELKLIKSLWGFFYSASMLFLTVGSAVEVWAHHDQRATLFIAIMILSKTQQILDQVCQ